METITPIVTTVQRKVEGLILLASLPPKVPPIIAKIAITKAALQLTWPEKTKNIAAAILTLNAIACLSAFNRVSESLIRKPNTASTITLNPAPK